MIDIDDHNKRRARIILDEARTLGLDCSVGRMMRANLEELLKMVAGHASAMEIKAEQCAVEREMMIDKIEQLEATR